MSYLRDQEELRDLLLSGYPFVFVVCEDDYPVFKTLNIIAEKSRRNYDFFSWNCSGGLFYENKKMKTNPACADENEVLHFIENYDRNAIFLLQDFHLHFGDPKLVSALKETIQHITIPLASEFSRARYSTGSDAIKHIVVTSPVQKIPPEINKLTNIIHFGLPGKEEILEILEAVIGNKRSVYADLTAAELEKIVNSAIGLTETEIFNAFAKSMHRYHGKIDYQEVTREKIQIIKKDSLLEYHEPAFGLDEVGGLKHLINWVKKRKIAYNEELRLKYHLELPKGLLMTGVQGCGKSHSVKAISHFLEMPLIRMDVGALMNKWVGESEENVRKAIKLAESVAPAILWIDEIDKAIPDPRSGNTHEVTQRMLSTLLTWLQEKTSPVFVIATANNIDHLPPELMRKGRFDEIFFIDLPKFEERREILAIHLKRKHQNPDSFDLDLIARCCEGFSGAEIQVLINESIFEAAFRGERLHTNHLLEEIRKTTPLSVTMKDKIEAIRNWAKTHNVRPAS